MGGEQGGEETLPTRLFRNGNLVHACALAEPPG